MTHEPIELTVLSNNFRAGKYILTDVSEFPAWDNVLAVEEHRDLNGKLRGTVNHRVTFVEAAIRLHRMANDERLVLGPRRCSGHDFRVDPDSHWLIDICIKCGEERA